ncbi:flagellin [Litchfieldella xinjiangensis]|uniref:flagellin N-terminal helical domain-containing protein n=1 Tax=Litchfieldella xinjiangensis TaxID=1166948 RepID=UPI0005BD81BA|nr:flagellin [Halomonas xinjiangensis]
MSVINTNITALIGQNNLGKAQSAQQTAMERLSSGLRINSAKDDAAGQAIANRMSAQITGMNQASRNANDGVSMIQTMEGGLDQINNNLQRIRELTVQAASDTNSADDRTSIQTEIDERIEEIGRISGSADFNGTKVLNGTDAMTIQVGANNDANDRIDVNKVDATTATLGLDDLKGTYAAAADATATPPVEEGDLTAGAAFSAGDAQSALDTIDSALDQINTARSTLGATLNRFDSVIENLSTTSTNLSAARSRIEDADYAVEVSNMTRAGILQQAGTSVLAQANQVPQSVLSLLG